MTHLCQLNQTPAFPTSRRAMPQPLPAPQLQRGASLLEGIAYLGIAAVVVLGAVSLLGGAFTSAKSNQAIEETVALRTAVRKVFLGQAYTTEGMVATLIQANAVPGTLAKGANNTLVNGWGGTVDVASVTGGFKITYGKVPKDVCINMLNGSNGWVSVSQGQVTKSTFPLSVTDVNALCVGENGSNDLAFTSI